MARYIDADALFKRVTTKFDDCEEFIELIETQPTADVEERKKGEWIPCSERLPKEETDVFICNANGDMEISRGSYSTEVKDDFIWYTSGWRFGKVIAWMPLPEPWKGDNDERFN